MITVEGYKMFHGTMRIKPVASSGMPPIEASADWLYKPECKCWYGGGSSYPEEICERVTPDNPCHDCQRCDPDQCGYDCPDIRRKNENSR